MAVRVLAHPVAKERIVALRALLAGGFIENIQQLLANGDELANPEHWDGPRAIEFRGMWPGLRSSLLDAHGHLTELGASIDSITSAIMSAGGN
ncbi:MAG: hypothetical protein QOF34_1318 [Sphingomonadales bacterium]|nr:hypothetical protein [Sphingomonadales bacterium]